MAFHYLWLQISKEQISFSFTMAILIQCGKFHLLNDQFLRNIILKQLHMS